MPKILQNAWSKAIKLAERDRSANRSVMDMLGATEVVGVEEEAVNQLSASPQHWLHLALSIEEKQFECSFCSLGHLLSLSRMDIQDRVRRLQQEPREDDKNEVERLRHILAADLISLESSTNSGMARNLAPAQDHPAAFDGQGDEAEHDPIHFCPPEQRPIYLPSTHLPEGHALRREELKLRIKQAARYLAALRESIADKSFQFSHVFRDAPSKTTRTRSRGIIAQLNNRITWYCRIYGQTRAAMVRLGADEKTLATFQVLVKDDVKASTAILDPNEPGSSSIKLSWIWQTKASGGGTEKMEECERAFSV